jgi:L-fuconolactonase
MYIDAHQHFWSIARGDYGWLRPDTCRPIYRDVLPADLEPHLKRHGIMRTVLVQAAPSIEETEYLLGLADATPWVGAVVGWIDFDRPDHLGHLRRWANHRKFRAVRPMIQDIADDAWALKPAFDPVYKAIQDLDLHFEFLGQPRHLEAARTLAARHAGLRIVLDHAMKPAIRLNEFEPWATELAALAQAPNVVCKLSGLVTEADAGWTLLDIKPYVDHVISNFGPARVLWGSDWPVVNMNGSYDAWRAVTLALVGAHTGAHQILGGTAARVYRLDGFGPA